MAQVFGCVVRGSVYLGLVGLHVRKFNSYVCLLVMPATPAQRKQRTQNLSKRNWWLLWLGGLAARLVVCAGRPLTLSSNLSLTFMSIFGQSLFALTLGIALSRMQLSPFLLAEPPLLYCYAWCPYFYAVGCWLVSQLTPLVLVFLYIRLPAVCCRLLLACHMRVPVGLKQEKREAEGRLLGQLVTPTLIEIY